jgi:hypothetical protein
MLAGATSTPRELATVSKPDAPDFTAERGMAKVTSARHEFVPAQDNGKLTPPASVRSRPRVRVSDGTPTWLVVEGDPVAVVVDPPVVVVVVVGPAGLTGVSTTAV